MSYPSVEPRWVKWGTLIRKIFLGGKREEYAGSAGGQEVAVSPRIRSIILTVVAKGGQREIIL